MPEDRLTETNTDKMMSPNDTAPDPKEKEKGALQSSLPPVDINAELDRVRETPEVTQPDEPTPFSLSQDFGSQESKKGVALKVGTIRVIGEGAGMLAAWLLVLQAMNGVFEKRFDKVKWNAARKYILPRVEWMDGIVEKYIPGIATKELNAARASGDMEQLAREYAPYLVDMPISVVASFGGKVAVQEALNRKLDVPLDTHENMFSAGLDNAVQAGAVICLASRAGAVPKAGLESMFKKVLSPLENDPEKLNKMATYMTNLQVPNIAALGVSTKYLIDQALEEVDKRNGVKR